MAHADSTALSAITDARALASASRRAWRRRRWLRYIFQYSVLTLVTILFLLPIYWMVITALKDTPEVLASPPVWWPTVFHFENFPNVLTNQEFPFFQYAWNSFFYAGSVTIGTVLSSSVVAYGFARLRFPGRNLLFAITLATMMVPSIVTFMPNYLLFRYLGLLGTYAPLIVPNFFGNAFFIFMMRQFYMGLPFELSDAAKVDGAGEFRIFLQVMLPLVRSALIVVAVFSFVWTWQDFFGPLVYLTNSDYYPLSVGVFEFRAARALDWPMVMAASTIFTLPLVVLFFILQRYFLRGVALTGIKR